MFLQQLKLSQNKSYRTTEEIDNLIESMHLQYKHIPIICLSSKESWSNDRIEEALKSGPSSPRLTIPQYTKYREQFDSSHILFPEASQANEFGYSIADLDKPIITTDIQCDFERLLVFKMFIRAKNNDRLVAIYILAQKYTLAIFTKQKERLSLFCKIFKLNARVISYEEGVEAVDEECAVFIDGYVEVSAERIIIIGNGNTRIQELTLDLSVAGKYKYRVLDVARRLSPNTVKHSLIDYSKFKDINN